MPKDDAECKCGHEWVEHGVTGACEAADDSEVGGAEEWCPCEEFTPV